MNFMDLLFEKNPCKLQKNTLYIVLQELHCLLKAENDDKKRLAARIDRLMIRNEDLSKQLERAKGTSLKPVPLGVSQHITN